MEFKKGQTVFLKRENTKIQNPPTSGKIHSVGKSHVVLRTVGGTGLYKARLDNLSHERKDSWLHQKYGKKDTVSEDAAVAPTNSAGAGQIAGIGVGPKGEPGVTAKWHKKHIERNSANAPSPIMAPVQTRKTLSDFVKGK